MDDDDRRLLGLPPIAALAERFYEAVAASDGAGISVRDMAKRGKDAPLIDWMRAGAAMKGVKHSWSPVKGDLGSAQESHYTLAPASEA